MICEDCSGTGKIMTEGITVGKASYKPFTITSAEFNNLYTNPVVLVESPGKNRRLVVDAHTSGITVREIIGNGKWEETQCHCVGEDK